MAAAASSYAIEGYLPRFLQRLHSKYIHNPHIFNGQWAKNLEQSSAVAAKANNSMSPLKYSN